MKSKVGKQWRHCCVGGVLLFCTWAVFSCAASSKKGSRVEDAGPQKTYVKEDAGSVMEPSLGAEQGKVEILARWLWPKAELRRSPGRNHCGFSRPPALRVELMGGLEDVVVFGDSGQKPGDTKMVIENCQLRPRLVVVGVGHSIAFQNMGEGPQHLILEELDIHGKSKKVIGALPMRVPGQTYGYRADHEGLLRVHSRRDPKDFAYIQVTEKAAMLSNHRGLVTMEMSKGPHSLSLWHPPIEGAEGGIFREFKVEIQAQRRIKQSVDLSQSNVSQ